MPAVVRLSSYPRCEMSAPPDPAKKLNRIMKVQVSEVLIIGLISKFLQESIALSGTDTGFRNVT